MRSFSFHLWSYLYTVLNYLKFQQLFMFYLSLHYEELESRSLLRFIILKATEQLKWSKRKLKQKDNKFYFLQILTLREEFSPYKHYYISFFGIAIEKILFAIILTFFDYFMFLQSIQWAVLFWVTWILLRKFEPHTNARFNQEITFEDRALSVICGWTLIFLYRNDLNNYALGIGFNGVILGAISFRIFSLL